MPLESTISLMLDRLPSAALSRAFSRLADVALPSEVQGRVNRAFARFAGIALDESEHPPESYRTLNDFFTRRLRPGVHVLDGDDEVLVSPVDGRLSEFGRIEGGTLVQAKGRTYTVGKLLDDDPDMARLVGGSYATLYLSPRDYHRIHAPIGGEVMAMAYTPGRLLPVNRLGVAFVDELFARNERLTTWIETGDGRRVGVVKVGATCVGRIGVAYDSFVTNQERERVAFRREYGQPLPVARGDELGVFNLGSTVVLLIEGDFEFGPDLELGQAVRMGNALGTWL